MHEKKEIKLKKKKKLSVHKKCTKEILHNEKQENIYKIMMLLLLMYLLLVSHIHSTLTNIKVILFYIRPCNRVIMITIAALTNTS